MNQLVPLNLISLVLLLLHLILTHPQLHLNTAPPKHITIVKLLNCCLRLTHLLKQDVAVLVHAHFTRLCLLLRLVDLYADYLAGF